MHKILVVDDDKISQAFIKRAFANKFAITQAYSGAQALVELEKNHPEVILLDVEMPGLNGYEVCEIIRANPDTTDIPIIFLSARGELRDRMQGFEAGADDYIVKPFQPDMLKAKLKVLIRHQLRRHELSTKVDEAQKTAFHVISSTSDLGQTINFIERSQTVSTFDQLTSAFFVVTRFMDLNCTLMIRSLGGNLFFSSAYNSVNPLESELIASLSIEKRYFDFGARTQINFPHISLLIKNMPLDDMERYGRVKDFFPAILAVADAKVAQLCSQQAVARQMEESCVAFSVITGNLNLIKSELDLSHKQGIKIMRSMMMELDKNLPRMGLVEDQEQYILDRVDQAIEQAHKAISDNKKTNDTFQTMLNDLDDLLSKQQQLQNLLSVPILDDSRTDDEGYQMDVEIF